MFEDEKIIQELSKLIEAGRLDEFFDRFYQIVEEREDEVYESSIDLKEKLSALDKGIAWFTKAEAYEKCAKLVKVKEKLNEIYNGNQQMN